MYFLSTITYSGGVLIQTVIENGYSDIARLNLETVRVFGFNGTVDTILVDGEPHIDFEVLPNNEIRVQNLRIPVISRYNITFTATNSNSNSAKSLYGYGCIFIALLYNLLNFAGVRLE